MKFIAKQLIDYENDVAKIEKEEQNKFDKELNNKLDKISGKASKY